MTRSRLKRAVFGVRMHSGWGVLVAVAGRGADVEVLDRRRIVVTDVDAPGAQQPYHHARALGGLAGAQHLENCAAVSKRLAVAAVRDVIRDLEGRHYRIGGAAVLLASGRPLPSLLEILASHPLIHTAEGEFFRKAVRDACEELGIVVRGFRERDLEQRASAVFGTAANRVHRRLSSLGKSLGPPWTTDQRNAALAAAMVLENRAGGPTWTVTT